FALRWILSPGLYARKVVLDDGGSAGVPSPRSSLKAKAPIPVLLPFVGWEPDGELSVSGAGPKEPSSSFPPPSLTLVHTRGSSTPTGVSLGHGAASGRDRPPFERDDG